MAEPVTARNQDSWVHQERCTKQGNCLPCPNTATDALSCHLTSFSVTVRGRERLEDTRLLVRDMFLSPVALYAWANGCHATVGGTNGYGCCSCPWPYFRALWPAATVVGTNATCDRITSLHLILAKRLKSSKHRHAQHPDVEGRLLLSLRLHFPPICVLTISAVDAGIFLKVGVSVVAIWCWIICY